MLDKVVIIGYSGHAYVVIEAARMSNISFAGYCEREPVVSNPYNLSYLGDECSNEFKWRKNVCYFTGIGHNTIRRRIAEHITNHGGAFRNIIHPSAWVSDTVSLGSGVFISAHASINALAKIGDQTILNTGCIVEHECNIGPYVHVAPGATLAGAVSIGSGTFIGANAVIKQGVKIGENVVVGAGAVVLNDIDHGHTVVGNPAKRKNI